MEGLREASIAIRCSQAWVIALALPLTSCELLAKITYANFSIIIYEIKIIMMDFFRRLNKIIFIKHLAQLLAPGKCSVNGTSPLILSLLFSMQSGSTSDTRGEDLLKTRYGEADSGFLSRLHRRPMFCLLGAVSLPQFAVKSTSFPVAGWEILPQIISLGGAWQRQVWEWSCHLIWFSALAMHCSSITFSLRTESLKQRRLHFRLSLAWLCLSPGQVPAVNGSYFSPVNTASARMPISAFV